MSAAPSKNRKNNKKPSAQGSEARRVAASLLGLIVDEGNSLAALIDPANGNARFRALEPRDKALARAITISVLRHRGPILAVMKKVMDRPEPKRARALTHNLHCAAAQILFMDVPDSAAANIGVSIIASSRNTSRFKGFANAVLRRIAKDKDQLLEQVVPQASMFPKWLEKQIRSDFGKKNLEQISEMIRLEPYLDISLPADAGISEWQENLEAELLPTGSLRLTSTKPVQELAGYDVGVWWVQNAASAIPARLMGNVSGAKVADLCAAPGGKSAQLASAGAKVTSVDLVETRLERLKQNFKRLNLSAQTVCSDVLEWQPDTQFDHILLDAPCTSTGTIRRHPDVMWAKKPEEVQELGKLQEAMLNKAIDLTRSGGKIVFSTCSIAKAEGENVLANIVRNRDDIEVLPVSPEEVGGLEELINGQGAVRCLPHHMALNPTRLGGLDGFFAARMIKL